MRRHARAASLAALTSVFSGLAAADPSIAVAYCSSLNTADSSANSSTFQSEGLCYDFCNDGGYALGVLQDKNCWCSNYIPASGDRSATSKCEDACPGYPSDYCGGDGLYGYIQLSAAASGTKGSTSSTTSATSSSSTTTTETSITVPTKTVTETLQASVTTSSSESHTTSTSLTSPQPTEIEILTSTSSSPTETDAATSTTSTPKGSPTVITSIQTITSEGAVTTQTIVTTAWPNSGSNGSLSGGAIAGIVLGILAVIAGLIAGALIYRRHKKNQKLQGSEPLTAAVAGSHRRGSSAGIMSKAGTISSSGYGFGMEEDMNYASPGRRLSMKPMDPRLDFKQTLGLYRAASHDSINTIRDDQDYSRRVHDAPRIMRVTNPDPED